jgi:hypothetical protein
METCTGRISCGDRDRDGNYAFIAQYKNCQKLEGGRELSHKPQRKHGPTNTLILNF